MATLVHRETARGRGAEASPALILTRSVTVSASLPHRAGPLAPQKEGWNTLPIQGYFL